MSARPVTLLPVPGLPLVEPGDDLAALLIAALDAAGLELQARDVLVIAQKIVSKAEGRYVELAEVTPSPAALELAARTGKDPRLVEVVLGESEGVVRQREGVLIVAHRQGWVIANAAVDQSNIAHGQAGERVLLLPVDPDASANALKARLEARYGVALGIVVNDSFGRAWRLGVTGTAVGAAGLPALRNLIGRRDLFGRPLQVTEQAFADEIAAAASLLMGQADEGIPAVLVRGLAWDGAELPAAALVRPKDRDLFR